MVEVKLIAVGVVVAACVLLSVVDEADAQTGG